MSDAMWIRLVGLLLILLGIPMVTYTGSDAGDSVSEDMVTEGERKAVSEGGPTSEGSREDLEAKRHHRPSRTVRHSVPRSG